MEGWREGGRGEREKAIEMFAKRRHLCVNEREREKERERVLGV